MTRLYFTDPMGAKLFVIWFRHWGPKCGAWFICFEPSNHSNDTNCVCNWILFTKWKKASTGRVCVCKRLYTENLESSWYQLVRHMLFQHNAADKKWAPFGRRQFQMHSLEWKCLNFGYKFTEVCSQGTNWQNTSTDSDNGLVLNRQQAIIWTNGGLCCDATRPGWINDNLLCHQWRKSYITTTRGF